MGIITALTAQKKNKNRVNLFIDGEFYCGLELLTVMSSRLSVGEEIEESVLKEIIELSENSTAFEKAVYFTNIRMRSEHEMRLYLGQKGYTEDTIDTTIEKLKNYLYIDDERFARLYIDCHINSWGKKKLSYQLTNQLKVDGEIVSQLLQELEGQDEIAYNIASKYIRQKKVFDYQKTYTHLFSKGYDGETIRSVMSRIKQEQSELDD